MRPLVMLAFDWGVRAFGGKHMRDFPTRSLRVAEEAIELCQAHGVPREKMLELVDIVYARPSGDAAQELGGVLMSTTLLCAAMGFDTEDVFALELRRVLSKPPEHFRDRNETKIAMGLKA